MFAPAPFHADLADGPAGGTAQFVKTADGLRVRVGHFPCDGARGTVLLFPGRTEYIEKYGRTARDLTERGYAVLVIDWRGQGLADRLLDDPMVGHVQRFSDYQLDVQAMILTAEALELPRPWYLLAHSMGGAIGLRALHEGLAVEKASFSAPMWGISISAPLRPVAWALGWASASLGLGHGYAPGTKPTSYVATEPFDANTLTTDREMFDYMRTHLEAVPEFGLGGPSLHWLYEALRECRDLAGRAAPDVPALTWLGGDEMIVDPSRIHDHKSRWPRGRLEQLPGARHEVLMEDAETRRYVADTIAAFFDSPADGMARAAE